MGDVARMNAGDRYRTAVEQRLNDGDDTEAVLWEVVTHLERVSIDSVELNQVARDLAVDPGAIDVPE